LGIILFISSTTGIDGLGHDVDREIVGRGRAEGAQRLPVNDGGGGGGEGDEYIPWQLVLRGAASRVVVCTLGDHTFTSRYPLEERRDKK
jgi:hypothetical protein